MANVRRILLKCTPVHPSQQSLAVFQVQLWRRAWQPGPHAEGATHEATLAAPAHAAAPAPPVRITVLGSWWAALLLVCTTLMALASAFTAFILYVRPVLQVGLQLPPSVLLHGAVACALHVGGPQRQLAAS